MWKICGWVCLKFLTLTQTHAHVKCPVLGEKLTGAFIAEGIIEEGSCIPTILQAPSSNPDPVVLLAFCCMHSFHSPGHLKLPLSSPDGSLPHASITKIGQTNLIPFHNDSLPG